MRATDILWHLGDFGFGTGKRERFAEFRARIKCETVNLILGNHDHAFEPHARGSAELCKLFKRVRHVYSGKIGGRFFHLSHYAHRTWPWQHHNSWHCYGHSHANLPDDPNAFSLDVGVDTAWNGHVKYSPYSMGELEEIMAKKKFVPVDHHREGGG